jgi:predicted negative regulator of RcsB-dependent stress response
VEFETEEQQIDAIKKWFKEYGTTVAAGLILGIVGIFGYRYFIEQREFNMTETSSAYESVMEVLTIQKDQDKFAAEVDTFNINHHDTIYSNLLSFQRAKLAIDASDLDAAEKHLNDVLENAQHATVEHVARIRLARVLIGLKKADQALNLIAAATGDAYRGSYEMLRGDIWLQKGDRNRARQAYEAAKLKGSEGPAYPSLEMLLTDLADETATVEKSVE